MGIRWDDLRRMPLAVWRGYVDGFVLTQDATMRRLAWQVSLQLVAAGCKAEEVTPARLLGGKAPTLKQRIARDPEVQKKKAVDRVMAKWRAQRAAGE